MTVKEFIGRHIYTIVSGALLSLAFLVLFAAGDNVTPIIIIIVVILVLCSACIGAKLAYRRWSPEVVFHLFMGGYVIFRLPTLVYHRGTFFAFCEARRGVADSNRADIVMRKGQLHGSKVRWGPLQVVAHDDNHRCANPVPIIDKETNTIMVLFVLLVPGASGGDFINKKHEQKIHIIKSNNWGDTWTREDITDVVIGDRTDASFYATGPCHGIQLKSGRLVVPGKFNLKAGAAQKACRHGTCDHSTVIYSDDHGDTWQPGGFVPYKEDEEGRAIHTCEATILELQDNVLCMNSRTLHPEHPRAQSFSHDGGISFHPPELPHNLCEQAYNECGYVNPERGGAPGCQGSILGFPAPPAKFRTGSVQEMSNLPLLNTNPTWALFCNPATRYNRFKMGVRLSKDGCETWSRPWTIWRMASGYSDMALCISGDDKAEGKDDATTRRTVVDSNDQLRFAVLFESGLFFFWETVAFKMFNVDDVMRNTET